MSQIRLKQWALVGLLMGIVSPGLIACHETDPVPNIPGLTVNNSKNIVVIEDSFEREEIFADPNVQTLLGWRGFINDWGLPVLGLEGNQVRASIFSEESGMGPSSDGDHALYFTGRPGRSIHSLFLISQTYDLTDFNSSIFSFDYLTFDLNDSSDQPEFLRVEICAGTLNECGINEDALNPDGLNDESKWAVIFEHDPAFDADVEGSPKFNGTDHTANDWQSATLLLDLNDIRDIDGNSLNVDKSAVSFRFHARMHDGFKTICNDGNEKLTLYTGAKVDWQTNHASSCVNPVQILEDGAAIDKVRVDASTLSLDDRF